MDKKEANDALLTIPGYTRDESVGIKPEAVQKLRTAAGVSESFENQLKELIALQKEAG